MRHILILLLFSLSGAAVAQQKERTTHASDYPVNTKMSPVDYVKLYMGTINPKTRGTIPVIKVPGGNVSLFPSFTPEMEDLYLADKIYGFPLGFGNLMTVSYTHLRAHETGRNLV